MTHLYRGAPDGGRRLTHPVAGRVVVSFAGLWRHCDRQLHARPFFARPPPAWSDPNK